MRTLARSWDGTAIDVNVAFPKASPRHHGGYPLVMIFHGYGGSKIGLDSGSGGIGSAISSMRPWLRDGYATFSMTDRGFGESCGTAASRAAVPAAECAIGFNHLMDTRYEVRDAQFFAGELVDEGLVNPNEIGATGGSYGGGTSLALDALHDRMMLPDGRLVPWRSPAGRPMHLAAAAPFIPWSDLPASLTPNGSTLDYVADAAYRGRYGVLKQSLVSTLYATGCGTATTFCTSSAENWDLGRLYTRLRMGEPYGGPYIAHMFQQLERYHSAFGIDPSVAPAPALIANGWSDDLFPVDEALRYYNAVRARKQTTPISLYFGDWGHPRAQNKPADLARYVAAVHGWMDYYLRGRGHRPFAGVRVLTETCPASARSVAYHAANPAELAPGEVRLDAASAQTIAPDAGAPAIGRLFDPLNVGAGACATAPAVTQPGTATYRLRVAHPFTVLGAPTVIADFRLRSQTSQVAARLLDVSPAGTERLVARGLWRPVASGRAVRQVFQLHPAAWRFPAGDTVKLELLPSDAPYGQPSVGQAPVTVSHLQLRLPVHGRPGSADGLVRAPLTPVVPKGEVLAPDYRHLPGASSGRAARRGSDRRAAGPGPNG